MKKRLAVFPTWEEWGRMPRQGQDAYLSSLEHPIYLSESELEKLTPDQKKRYHQSVRDCEQIQFMIYLAEQQVKTEKGLEATQKAIERIETDFLENFFTVPTGLTNEQHADKIELRDLWIKCCECEKQQAIHEHYKSRQPCMAELVPEQAALLTKAADHSAAERAADNSQATVDEIRNHGQLKPKQAKKHGRTLTQKELDENIRKNELITEIRRRAKSKHTLGADGITAAYDEIDEESKQAGSKWLSIMSLAPRKAIIDKARHNKRYVTAQ